MKRRMKVGIRGHTINFKGAVAHGRNSALLWPGMTFNSICLVLKIYDLDSTKLLVTSLGSPAPRRRQSPW